MNILAETTRAGDGRASLGLLVVIGLGVLLIAVIHFMKKDR